MAALIPVNSSLSSKTANGGAGHSSNPGGYSRVQSNSLSPTADLYNRLHYAYRHFNAELFDGRLPDCLLTLARQKKTLGYFGADFFSSTDADRAHEICLNPAYFEPRGDEETLSTLVHEQTHLARHEFGDKNRVGGRGSRGYHDKVWAAMMLSIGLHPTHDGTFNGHMTGYRMTHLIIKGGPFDRACQALIDSGFKIRWRDHRYPVAMTGFGPGDDGQGTATEPGDDNQANPNRLKFTCPNCRLNAWAKPSARLTCTVCNRPMAGTVTLSTSTSHAVSKRR